MPIVKTSEQYVAQIHKELCDHYHITFPIRITRTIINQYKESIHNALKQAYQIELANTLTISPSTPLLRSIKSKYYNLDEITPPKVSKLRRLARKPRNAH